MDAWPTDFLQAGRYCHAPRAPLAAHCTEMGPSLGIPWARIKVPSSHALSDPGRPWGKILPPMGGWRGDRGATSVATPQCKKTSARASGCAVGVYP